MTTPEQLLAGPVARGACARPGRRATRHGPAARRADGDGPPVFGAQACSLALLSDDERELVYTTASGAGDVTGLRLPSGQGVAGWVAQSGQPVAIDDVRGDPRFAGDVAEQTGYVPQALVAAPVTSARGLLGVLTLLDRDAERPGAEQDLALLQLFCDQAAIALEGARAFSDVGRVLLAALADAAGRGTPLADALAEDDAGTDGDRDDDLAALAGLLADLGRQGRREQRLAVRVAQDVVAYAREASRPGR